MAEDAEQEEKDEDNQRKEWYEENGGMKSRRQF